MNGQSASNPLDLPSLPSFSAARRKGRAMSTSMSTGMNIETSSELGTLNRSRNCSIQNTSSDLISLEASSFVHGSTDSSMSHSHIDGSISIPSLPISKPKPKSNAVTSTSSGLTAATASLPSSSAIRVSRPKSKTILANIDYDGDKENRKNSTSSSALASALTSASEINSTPSPSLTETTSEQPLNHHSSTSASASASLKRSNTTNTNNSQSPPSQTTSTSSSFLQLQSSSSTKKRVLRSGDTIESFFCLIRPVSSPTPSSSSSNTSMSSSTQEYNRITSLCNDIVNDTDHSSFDIKKWKDVLLYVYKSVDQLFKSRVRSANNNSNTNDMSSGNNTNWKQNIDISSLGMNLIRLHKRATSRFGTNIPDLQKLQHKDQQQSINEHDRQQYEKDLLTIWLQYAKVQYRFNTTMSSVSLSSSSSSLLSTDADTRSTFQLLQNRNLGQNYSDYYIALADFELYASIGIDLDAENVSAGVGDLSHRNIRGKGKEIEYIQKAKNIIENGIRTGAKPEQLLHEYLQKLEKFKLNSTNNDKDGKDIGSESRIQTLIGKYSKNRNKETNDNGNMNIRNKRLQRKELVENYDEEAISKEVNTSERNNDSSNESLLVSKYLSRSSKRPITELRTKMQRDRCQKSTIKGGAFRTFGGPPKRISSIDDDYIDDDEDNQYKLDDSVDELVNKRQKVSYLVKQNEKITPDYIKYLNEWDPVATRKKPLKPKMDKINEDTKENQPSCTSLTSSNNTASNGTKSSNISSQNMADIQNTSTKKDYLTNNHKREKIDVSITEIPTQIEMMDNVSPSVSFSEADPDFLPLINEKRVLTVNKIKYLKLGVIGKGGSCKVYRSLTKDCCTVAIKKVKLAGMTRKSIEGYANEIRLLHRLRGNQAIIQLYDSEVDIKRKAIFLVMEAGEADLNHVLRDQSARKSDGRKQSINMNFIRLTWQQMLSAVHCIHEERIIHGDLKPANFLFVKGVLKLIDFGIAKAIQCDNTTNIYRDSQVGTLNYMSPESIQDSGTGQHGQRMKCGRPSDVWSLGCILYQMCYGKTPFADIHSMIPKLQAIINPMHKIEYPNTITTSAIDAMKLCLERKPEDRAVIVGNNGLLNKHWFLHCDKK